MNSNFKAVSIALLSLSFAACGHDVENPQEQVQEKQNLPKLTIWKVPETGTSVVKFSKKIEGDDLNDFKFSVEVKTIASTATDGNFAISYGVGNARTTLNKPFPKWYENNVVQPIIKPVDSLQYGASIGFDPGDGSFKDLYLVVYKNGQLKISSTKYYNVSSSKNL